MGLRSAIAMRLLPAYSGGDLPAPLRRWMRGVVAVDADVAAAYELLRRAERRAGNVEGLSTGQTELLLRQLLDDVDDAAPAAPGWGSLGPALGALACAGVLVVLLPGPAPDDLSARGLAADPIGVHVRCVVGDAVVDEASAGARQTGAQLDCAGGLLAFSTTNLSARPQFAFVVGIDSDSRPVWLPPFSSTSPAVSTPAGSADVVLRTLARLPGSGDLTLFVLLSDEAFGGSEVERRLDAAVRAGVPLAQLERLPVDVDSQARLTVRRPR
ncbi:MAG: hypothetical protein Q8O67_15580 [Deltaproteobacteria bacterium]|nr:hypothetical protein [Deltaproteobacteria bacterium]